MSSGSSEADQAAPDIARLVRADIQAMRAYAPGEQVNKCTKLNTNECAWGPSPAVLAALQDTQIDELRQYPQPTSADLRQAAADLTGCQPEQILVGNGSDDCLTILYRTHCVPGDTVACPWPTYSLYDTLAGLQGVTMTHVPYAIDADHNWTLPVETLVNSQARMLLIANPNNPSATFIDPDILSDCCQRFDGLVVVDEAYVDFATAELGPDASMLQRLDQHPNLVVLRTFSKSYSLAGARLGLMFAHQALIDEYVKVKDSYNVNALTQRLGIAALADRAHHSTLMRDTLQERQRLGDALSTFGWTWPVSRANFLLCHVGPQAGSIYTQLKERGILVRWWQTEELSEFLRITVGRPEENDALLQALKELL